MNYIDIEKKVVNWYKSIPLYIKKSFLFSFILINVAFLFHTTNFMFGDHDWLYVRGQTLWKEGTFEGRPLHFVLQSVLFSGQILPLLNNLFSFAFLAISSIMLAKYWKIKGSTFNYSLFATFIAVMPYTLVWLYYAKDALINLSLPFIVMSALWLSKIANKKTKLIYNALSIILLIFAFSSYVAIINMVGICVLGAIIIDYVSQKERFISIIKKNIPIAIDVIISLLIFKIIISLSSLTSSYNTKIIPLDFIGSKLIETFKVMFTQFTAILPFMEYKYKMLLVVMSIIGFIVALYRAGMKKIIPTIGLFALTLFASKFAYFIADERGEILAEMENFAFVPRLDFYGLVYVYGLFLSFILTIDNIKLKKVCTALAIIITFMSIVRDSYALKTWKLGFDAEMKAHERIVSRLEQKEAFTPDRKYKLFQVGSLSLRKNYYKKELNEETGLDLLETSFTPQYMSRIVYNFYYHKDIFYDNAVFENLSAKGKEYLRSKAKPWPSEDSIFIDGDAVIIVLTDEGLLKLKRKYNI